MTLVELLVTIFCSTIALTMLTGTLLFLTKTNEEILGAGEQIYEAKNVRDYILKNPDGLDEFAVQNKADGTRAFIYESTEVYDDVRLLSVTFAEKDGFVYCTLVYPEKEYKFIVKEK